MSVDKLCRQASMAVREKLRSKQTLVRTGRITNSGIAVAGGVYPYSVAVDIPITVGDWVYVVLNESNTRAVVIGR